MHTLFGTKHLLLLLGCLVLVVLGYLSVRKTSLTEVCRKLFYLGILSELIKIVYYITANEATHGGILPRTDLPFHLCSIQILFLAAINFLHSEKLKRVLYSFMLPSCLFGGIAAMLLATTSSLNGRWILTAQYFIYHCALVILALKLFTAKEFTPVLGDYFNCLKFLVGLLFFAIYINSILYDGQSNINFMYVASPPVSGLPYLNEKQGWLVYITRYAVLVVTCVTLCYGRVICRSIQHSLAQKKQHA